MSRRLLAALIAVFAWVGVAAAATPTATPTPNLTCSGGETYHKVTLIPNNGDHGYSQGQHPYPGPPPSASYAAITSCTTGVLNGQFIFAHQVFHVGAWPNYYTGPMLLRFDTTTALPVGHAVVPGKAKLTFGITFRDSYEHENGLPDRGFCFRYWPSSPSTWTGCTGWSKEEVTSDPEGFCVNSIWDLPQYSWVTKDLNNVSNFVPGGKTAFRGFVTGGQPSAISGVDVITREGNCGFCQGGTNNGLGCGTVADCPGGGCNSSGAACSNDAGCTAPSKCVGDLPSGVPAGYPYVEFCEKATVETPTPTRTATPAATPTLTGSKTPTPQTTSAPPGGRSFCCNEKRLGKVIPTRNGLITAALATTPSVLADRCTTDEDTPAGSAPTGCCTIAVGLTANYNVDLCGRRLLNAQLLEAPP